MKKVLITTTLATFVSVTLVFAFCGMCGIVEANESMKGFKGSMKENWAEKKVEMMTEKLGLSEEQATQLKAIMDQKMEKKKAIWAEKKEKMDALREEYKTNLKGILTEKQMEKYEAMKEEKGSAKGSKEHGGKEHGKEHGGKEHGGTEQKGSR